MEKSEAKSDIDILEENRELKQEIVGLKDENAKLREEIRALREQIQKIPVTLICKKPFAEKKKSYISMATPKRMKLRHPLPPELLSEMHKCLLLEQQIQLIGNVPSRVIVQNNAKRVQRTLKFISIEALNSNSMPDPEPSNQPKEWHRSITSDLRNHLVEKLVKETYPHWKSTNLISNSKIKDLLFCAYVRKMQNLEREYFEVAPDKDAYYQMLAEKIYKIQKQRGLLEMIT